MKDSEKKILQAVVSRFVEKRDEASAIIAQILEKNFASDTVDKLEYQFEILANCSTFIEAVQRKYSQIQGEELAAKLNEESLLTETKKEE